MLDLLPAGHTAPVQLPGEGGAWRLHSTGGYLVLASDRIDIGCDDRAEALRGCLWSNMGSELVQAQARFVFDDGHVALEVVGPADALDEVVECGSKLVKTARDTVLQGERMSAEQLEQELDDVALEQDTAAEDVELLAALEALATTDAHLSGLLSIDRIQGCGLFEPDDESWVVAISPSSRSDCLTLTVAVAPLPDAETCCTMLERSLALGSSLVVGPDYRIGCDPQASVLLLVTDINPRVASVDDVKAALGGLLVLSERLAERVLDGEEMRAGAAHIAGSSSQGGSLGMYSQTLA